MQIREVMTTNVRTVEPTASLVDVAGIMRDADTGVVPVVSGGMLVGVITDRDVVIRAVAEGADVNTATIDQYLTRNPTTVTPDADVREALQLMEREQVRRLPVAENGQLIGIVSIGDLAVEAGQDRLVGEALEGISAAPPSQ